jgi:hypothetical protein
LNLSPYRRDIPFGQVPDYKTFVRHSWLFVDEHGHRAVTKPPVMFQMRFSAEEAVVVRDSLDFLRAFIERSRAALFVDGATLILQVYDLDALHALAMAVSARHPVSETHRKVAESLIWALGFRWV